MRLAALPFEGKAIMIKLKILRTGNALVIECFNICFFLDDDSHYLMVDGWVIALSSRSSST